MVGTFKIITLASSIEEGIVDIFKDTFHDSGAVNVEGARLRCWKHGGHGTQTYLEVVENSCNPGFVNLGLKLGKETLFSYIKKLGFGKKTGVDLNGESSGILFNMNKVGLLELATTAFGQGISVTPLQQVTAVSAIINGGTLYKPYIVKSFKEPETGEIIKEIKPTVVCENVISKKTSELVRYALESVVANGTGRNAFIDGYRVGGKTGTAQKVNNGVYMVGNYILSFIGFLPADNPEIVVYVAIDNPKGVVQYGGTVSAPVAKAVMLDAINSLNIKKRKDGMEKEYQWFDKKYKTIPEVVGLEKKEAVKLLKDFQIEYTGTGSKVLSISPESGNRILEGSKVRILLGE